MGIIGVGVVLTDGQGRILLGERVKDGEEPSWCLPGGAVDPGERFEDAAVRELRLLAAYRPPYNRRSRNPSKVWWVVLTDEPFPRLSVVRQPRDGALGPFTSRNSARAVADTLADLARLRTCTRRIPATGAAGPSCVLAELGSCGAPCIGAQTAEDYRLSVRLVSDLIDGVDGRALGDPALRTRGSSS